MTLTSGQRERELDCPFPPHPEFDDGQAMLVTESAWSRFRGWLRHAPAERLPLPSIPVVWTATEIMHAVGVHGLYVGAATFAGAGFAYGHTARKIARDADPDAAAHPVKTRMLPAEVAAVTGVVGSWVTAGTVLGPLAGPDHLLTLLYAAGTGGGYWWLRKHEAVQAARRRRDEAAAWEAQKIAWHRLAPQLGLQGSHLLKYEDTLLGDARLIDTRGTGRRASQINGHDVAERLAEIEVSSRGRVDVTPDKIAGRLWITRRTVDPWRQPVMHPAASGSLDTSSPYAKFTPYPATVRKPLNIGIDPETGEPLQVTLWDTRGGKVVQITAKKDGGKTTLLDSLTERITACPDAVLLQINLSKALEDGWWAPLSAASALDREIAKARYILQFVNDVIRERPRGGRQTRVHQPTPAEPLFVVKIDEFDVVAADQICNQLLQTIDSKCRSEGVAIVKAGQRATAQWSGGGSAQANTDTAIWGKFARGRERGHVAGQEADLPDMGEYGEGHSGVFAVAELPYTGSHSKGRTFYWGEEAPGLLALVAARAAGKRPYVLEPALAHLADAWAKIIAPGDGDEDGEGSAVPPAGPAFGGQMIQGTEQITAKIGEARALAAEDPDIPEIPPEMEEHAAQMAAERRRQFMDAYTSIDIPPAELAVIRVMLAAPDGTTSSAVAAATGKSRATAHRYLTRLVNAGHAEMRGEGRGGGFRAPAGTPAGPPAGAHLHLVEPARDEAAGDAR